ncbi:MAG TPA: hypothetical protein PLG48_01170 [Candidatus Avimonas sp.]|nr:hypothetical protein [Clostridiales bacterium]HPU58105.1 hypothetical protein [Candidatus Avimonas sp.]
MGNQLKQKLPLIIVTAAAVILVVSVSLAGVLLFKSEYKLRTRDVPSSDGTSVKLPAESSTLNGQSAGAGNTSSTNPARPAKSDSISVKGNIPANEFDVQFYAKRLYELKYLFAVNGFKSVSELSPSVVVQFAFCHLYFDSLVDMPDEKDLVYRQVLPESISSKIQELFGKNNVDIKKSDLYNQSKDVFEMWLPRYRTSVYADVECKKSGADTYEVTATFYKDKDKKQADSTVSGVFKKEGKNLIISSMQTKK